MGNHRQEEYFISTNLGAKGGLNTQAQTNKVESVKERKDTYQKQVSKAKDKAIKKVKKHHHIAVHTAFFVAIAALLVFGNRSVAEPASAPSYSVGFSDTPVAVDEVSSADVAATIAREANLIIADNVQNLADTLNAQVEFAATADEFVTKPQIVETDVKTKDDVTTYVAKEGESVSSVAAKFNITSDTIRWANDITGDYLAPGTELTILPVSGILHTAAEGESAATLAGRYGAVKEQIVAFNDLEIDGLTPGSKVIIPDGEAPAVAPVYFSTSAPAPAPSVPGGFAFGNQPLYGGNGYSYGYCTWHAANRRSQIGRPIPRNLGNAVTWASVASAAGLGVGEAPQSGAVLWHKNTYIAGGFGHVGFVEKVNPDGSALVSDMNYPVWGGVTLRTIPPAELAQYLFIY